MSELSAEVMEAVESEVNRLSQQTWLSRQQARCVVLRGRGHEYSEIANHLDVAKGTVSKVMIRVRNAYHRRAAELQVLQDEYRSVVDREYSGE